MSRNKQIKAWAIKGDCGLYTGWQLTRQNAISDHCSALGYYDWREAVKKGDRAVKITVTEGWK